MWPSKGGVSLLRSMVTLARTAQTGVLHVECDLGRARLSVCAGKPRAMSALGHGSDCVGDALLREGLLDPEAHRTAWLEEPARNVAPVGTWLSDSGLVTRGALEATLRAQLSRRFARAVACEAVEHRFVAGEPAIGVPLLDEPPGAGDLVASALRHAARNAQVTELRTRIPKGTLRLTVRGAWLASSASMWPEEAALCALLASDEASSQAIEALCVARPRALVWLAMLLELGAAKARQAEHSEQLSLLVRKRRQIRARESARSLLDLPTNATAADARRALRKLAASLHPDALSESVPPSVRHASHEVMQSLIDAERRLREAR